MKGDPHTEEVPNAAQAAEDECVAALLHGMPDEGNVKRSTLEKIVRAAFSSGWKLAGLGQSDEVRTIQ